MAQIGGTVIAVIAGRVFQSAAVANLEAALDGHGFPDEAISGAVARVQSVLFGELEGDMRTRAIAAITQATQKSFVQVMLAGAVVVISGLFVKVERPFEKLGGPEGVLT